MTADLEGMVSTGEWLLRLALAVVLGGAIGLEREFHGRPAGLRTHIMVCLGATLAMLATSYLSRLWPQGSTLRIDPGRTVAGILTGIGFIGAGAIIRLKSKNRGLTTAACIWFVAALGVVIGAGAYGIAVGGTVLAYIVLHVLARLERSVTPDLYREIAIVADRQQTTIADARGAIEDLGFRVQSHEHTEDLAANELRATFSVKFRERQASEELLLKRLRELPGIRSLTWRFPAS